MSYCYGRLAPGPQKLADLTAYARQPLPAPPAEVPAPDLAYPMDDNDRLGCCTIAAVQHADQVWSDLEEDSYAGPSDGEIQTVYFSLTGGADTGLNEQVVLEHWRTAGFFGKKIAAYAPVAPKHVVTVKQVVDLFGLAYTGILVPSTAQAQFAGGQPWHLTGTPGDHEIEGGHAVPIVGYNATGPIVVTWGKLQQVTWQWWLTYAEECWAVLGEEIADAGYLHGVDVATLTRDLDRLT